MSAIFKEIKLTWQGKEYTLQPTMRVIQEIEQDVSIGQLLFRTQKGHIPLSHLALVLSILLSYAGVKDADQEKVYLELVNSETLAVDVVKVVLASFLPEKNSNAPGPEAQAPDQGIKE